MRGSIAGLSDKLKDGTNTWHDLLLACLDTAFSLFILAPAVVCYWRGVWELITIYLYPHDPVTSGLISMVVGFIGTLFATIFQGFFKKVLHPSKRRLTYYVCSRTYTMFLGFSGVNSWRGLWFLLDMYSDDTINDIAAMTIVSVVALVTMRALRNLAGSPFSISADYVEGYFEVPTTFRVTRTSKESRLTLFLLDCIFSVFVVGNLVVVVWRSIWVLMDKFLCPEDAGDSAAASLLLGYSLAIVVFGLQSLVKWICDRVNGLGRVLIADLYLFVAFFATCNIWRGIWNLLNEYYLPDRLELSCWTTHLVGLTILVLLNCSNTILVRGVYIDGEELGGNCVVFPCYFLRVHFQHAREKRHVNKRYCDRIQEVKTVEKMERGELICNSLEIEKLKAGESKSSDDLPNLKTLEVG